MRKYLGGYVREMGVSIEEILPLGRRNGYDSAEYFCMTILALRAAGFSNGVSRLHGEVCREMWQSVWPDVHEESVPIHSVTNGTLIAAAPAANSAAPEPDRSNSSISRCRRRGSSPRANISQKTGSDEFGMRPIS